MFISFNMIWYFFYLKFYYRNHNKIQFMYLYFFTLHTKLTHDIRPNMDFYEPNSLWVKEIR